MIIFRYLFKEVMVTFIATSGILLLIFMSTQFLHYLSDAVGGRFTGQLLMQVMLLQIPYLLSLLLPVGFYFAILLAYGRLHMDREMVILTASGFSQARLIGMTLIMATGIMVIVAVLALWAAPLIATEQNILMEKARTIPLVETLLPGRFFSLEGGKNVVYVESLSNDHKFLQNIFVATANDTTEPNKKSFKKEFSITRAASGFQMLDPLTGETRLLIQNGNRYTGLPGNNDFQVENFSQFTMVTESKTPIIESSPEVTATSALISSSSKDLTYKAELGWRFSHPLSVFLLAILAVPLSRVNPRQNKFAQILPAVLIYIPYANMLFVSRNWIGTGYLPPVLGYAWLHCLLLLVSLTLLFWQSSAKNRFIYRWQKRHILAEVSS